MERGDGGTVDAAAVDPIGGEQGFLFRFSSIFVFVVSFAEASPAP